MRRPRRGSADVPFTELHEMRKRYFIERKTMMEAVRIPNSTLSNLERGAVPFSPKYLSMYLDGYARLGFKNAKYQLSDIQRRGNPIASKENFDQ